MWRFRIGFLGITILLLAPAAGAAVEIGDQVVIHGFGEWAVGDTDGNKYLGGAANRGYDARSFALNVTAQPLEEFSVSAQVFWGPPTNNPEVIEADLDYAFGEWTFSDAAKLRGGIVKTPFGIYTEIFEVGTVRPFFDLPQGLYGPSEVVAKGYFGASLTGLLPAGGWEVQYDLYAGEIELDSLAAANPLLFAREGEGEGEGEHERLFFFAAKAGEGEGEEGEFLERKLVDMVGARIVFNTPVPGLSFGFSGFTGEPEIEAGGGAEARPTSQDVYGAHVEYLGDALSVRAEVAHREGGIDELEIDSAYLEVAYRIGEHWQVAARWDEADLTVGREPGRVPAPSLLEHEDLALGVNYWFSPGFVWKLAYHQVDGNLFAIPGRNPEILERQPLAAETDLVQIGVQFSF